MDVYGYQACVVKYGIEVDWFFFFFSLSCVILVLGLV